MITDDKDWHYLTVKSISKLLRRITSNHAGDFYCLNFFHSYTTKNRLKKHEKICRDHDFCYLRKPDENNKISKYIPGEKSSFHLLFMQIQNVYTKCCYYRGKDCREKFCKDLRDQAMKTNYEKKK